MTAFDDAFYILKNEYSFDLTHDSLLLKGKFEEANQLRGMRQFVLENENSADPAMRQAAEDMYQKLTQIMSAQSGTAPMQQPQGPVGEGANLNQMNAPPPQHPMMKAWANLKKNVVGHQDGQEYNMPGPIASMSQREQIPETMTQTMESQAPGMMGRFKQPVQQTAQIPTGQNSLGQRPATIQPNGDLVNPPPPPMPGMPSGGGPVQENQSQLGSYFEQQNNAPGAQVNVAPRPGPFAPSDDDPMGHSDSYQQSLSGQGYYVNDAGQDVTDHDLATSTTQEGRRFRNDPVGQSRNSWMGGDQAPQGSYGDQFAPNRNPVGSGQQ